MEGVTARILDKALAGKQRLIILTMTLLEQSDASAGIGFPAVLLSCSDLETVMIHVKRHPHRQPQPQALALPSTCNFRHLHRLELVGSACVPTAAGQRSRRERKTPLR